MRTNDPVIFRFGELTFDCSSHLLRRRDVEVHLSPKARQLLQMLLVNSPKAISREEIYDALWPSTYVCETNMASIVSELRRALGDDARSAQYIRTVHGFGYAFAGDVQPGEPDPRGIPLATLRCEGQRHLLYDGENSVGRSPDCRIVLTAGTVSRQHAVIIIKGRSMYVEDRGSMNGTYVNGQKVSHARVRNGDTLGFGTVQATISFGISSTLPLGLRIPTPRRHSSGSNAPA